MGIITKFFVTTEAHAREVLASRRIPPDAPFWEGKGVDDFLVADLRLALTGAKSRTDDEVIAAMEEPFLEASDDGPWLFRVPHEMTERLASMDVEAVASDVGERDGWRSCDRSDLTGFLDQLRLLASACGCDRKLYYLISL